MQHFTSWATQMHQYNNVLHIHYRLNRHNVYLKYGLRPKLCTDVSDFRDFIEGGEKGGLFSRSVSVAV
jgi:hypothetical protein